MSTMVVEGLEDDVARTSNTTMFQRATSGSDPAGNCTESSETGSLFSHQQSFAFCFLLTLLSPTGWNNAG
jgi:hypothetical protein